MFVLYASVCVCVRACVCVRGCVCAQIFSLLYSFFPYFVFLLLHRQQCVRLLFVVWWKFGSDSLELEIESVAANEWANNRKRGRPSKVKSSQAIVLCANKQHRWNIVSKIESTHFDLRRVISSMSEFNVLIFTFEHIGRQAGRKIESGTETKTKKTKKGWENVFAAVWFAHHNVQWE